MSMASFVVCDCDGLISLSSALRNDSSPYIVCDVFMASDGHEQDSLKSMCSPIKETIEDNSWASDVSVAMLCRVFVWSESD